MIKGAPLEKGSRRTGRVLMMTEGKKSGGRSTEGTSTQWRNWKWQLRSRVQSLEQLASAMGLPAQSLAAWRSVVGVYPFAITPYYWSLLDASDPEDPLRRQCFPDPRELDFSGGELRIPSARRAPCRFRV